MIITLPIPGRKLSPNSRTHPIQKSTITRRHRQAAFFATLAALGVRNSPKRLLLKDRGIFGIRHAKPLTNADYRKISALLHPAQPPAFRTYTLAFHHPHRRNRDDDNAAASCKAYRDGIADALRIDDNTLTMATTPAMLIDPAKPRLEIALHP